MSNPTTATITPVSLADVKRLQARLKREAGHA